MGRVGRGSIRAGVFALGCRGAPDEPALMDITDEPALMDITDEPALMDITDEPVLMDLPDERLESPDGRRPLPAVPTDGRGHPTTSIST
jgi:hypothetical protein